MKRLLNIFLILFISKALSQSTVRSEITILKDTKVFVSDNFVIESNGVVLNNGELIFKSNLTNNGVLSYTLNDTSGLVKFEGVNQQVLGTSTPVFYNLLFNNTTTIIKNNLQIDNEINFTHGIVNTRDNDAVIFFNEQATHTNVSNLSFIDGTVLKKGSSDFIFPIGGGNNYRYLTIENMNADNSFSSSYFFNNSNLKYPHNKKDDVIKFIDTKEYWELKRIDGDDYVIIELSRSPLTSSAEIMNEDLKNLHIVRWDNEEKYWVNESGIINETNNSIKTISKVSGYGIYALAIVNSDLILPDDVVIYNNLTPNDDGINDTFLISGIEKYPDNSVKVFNRWGNLVYEIEGYNNKDKVFKGIANKGGSFNDSEILPSGTYYYVLTYTVNGKNLRRIEYLYINGK